jgi:hypothetical protein
MENLLSPSAERVGEITATHRMILLDWLCELAQEFSLYTRTLHLAANFVDRVLAAALESGEVIERTEFQLLGVVCIRTAALKIESGNVHSTGEYLYYTDGAYTEAQMRPMEERVHAVVGERPIVATSRTYLDELISCAWLCVAARTDVAYEERWRCIPLSRYLLELSLLDAHFLRYEPHVVAATALRLAHHMMSNALREAVDVALVQSCGRSIIVDLTACTAELLALSRRVHSHGGFNYLFHTGALSKLTAVFDKYDKGTADDPSTYMAVAAIKPPRRAPPVPRFTRAGRARVPAENIQL